jgi:hypothetical protein
MGSSSRRRVPAVMSRENPRTGYIQGETLFRILTGMPLPDVDFSPQRRKERQGILEAYLRDLCVFAVNQKAFPDSLTAAM